MRRFGAFAVVDWSGENVARPKGLAAAVARRGTTPPALLGPADGWSRPAILDWLGRLADSAADVLIGVDLSPALPFADTGSYFPGWPQSPTDAKALWAVVDDMSAGEPKLSANGFLADAVIAEHFRFPGRCGAAFPAGAGRMRVCEAGQRAMGMSPQSCFNLVGAAQVGKSSLTGMRVLRRLAGRIPVWPFDPIPDAGPAIVEIYTAIAARRAGIRKGRSKIRDHRALSSALAALDSAPTGPLGRSDDHATDALLTAAWLRTVADDAALWQPAGMTPAIARTEGWTFGVA